MEEEGRGEGDPWDCDANLTVPTHQLSHSDFYQTRFFSWFSTGLTGSTGVANLTVSTHQLSRSDFYQTSYLIRISAKPAFFTVPTQQLSDSDFLLNQHFCSFSLGPSVPILLEFNPLY